jgi:periplasmic protein TonB
MTKIVYVLAFAGMWCTAWAQNVPVTDRGLHTQSNRPVTPPPFTSPSYTGKPHVCLEFYPAEARAAHIEGMTVLAFLITVDGAVKDVTIKKLSGNTALDQAAVTCASAWHYNPPLDRGKPVEVRWEATVKWILPD